MSCLSERWGGGRGEKAVCQEREQREQHRSDTAARSVEHRVSANTIKRLVLVLINIANCVQRASRAAKCQVPMLPALTRNRLAVRKDDGRWAGLVPLMQAWQLVACANETAHMCQFV